MSAPECRVEIAVGEVHVLERAGELRTLGRLAVGLEIAGLRHVVVLSAGTDGSDGPTDAAGAIADGDTLRRNPDARRYLDRNDSYRYFQPLSDLVITGPTNTNVMDVRIILVGAGK